MRSVHRYLFLLIISAFIGHANSFAQEDATVDALLKEGRALSKKNPERAIAIGLQLRSTSGTELRWDADMLLLTAYERVGKVDSAKYFGKEAITLSKLLEDSKKEASSTEKLGRLYQNVGESETARVHYGQSLAIYESIGDSAGISHIENLIGISHKKMGEYEEALVHYKRSLAIRKELDDKNRVAQTTNNIGNVMRLQGKLDSALSHYMDALAVFEALHDSSNMTNSLNNIGLIHKSNNDTDLALKYYRRVLDIRTLLNDQRGLQSIRNNLAIVYREQGMRDSALYFFNQNYDYAWSHGIKDAEALALHNAASVYMDDGQWDKAVNGFKAALKIREELKDRWGVASCNQNLGECYYRMGEYQKAIPFAEAALDISTEIGSELQTESTLKILHRSYAELGVFEKAYEYQIRRTALSDSLFAIDRANAISEMEAKYENEKSVQEVELANQRNALQEEKIKRQQTTRNFLYVVIGLILLIVLVYVQRTRILRKTNAELLTQKDVLAKNAQEKEMLLNEIHHRVKNNLQVVSSLLNMQSREVKDEKVLNALKEGRDRVHSMALVHQMFYQEHEDAASIEAHRYIEKLSDSLLRSYGGDQDGIELKLEVEECLLDIDRATLIGLIVNELVSNSLKYAFIGKSAGILTVSLKSSKTDYALIVSDNGSGKSQKTRVSSSFGLKLVDSMTKKLKGTMTVSSGAQADPEALEPTSGSSRTSSVTKGTAKAVGYSTKIVFPKTK